MKYVTNIKAYMLAHKIISAVVLVVVLGGGYYMYAKATSTTGQTRYVLGTASTSTIIAVVSESGQISASNSVDIKPKVTGTITWVGVKEGQKVSAGQALMTIDSTTARQQYNDDKQSLAAAELQYQKDEASAPIDFQKDQTALTNAQQDLTDEYSNAFDVLSSTYLDEPVVATGLNAILYGYDLSSSGTQQNVDALSNLFTNSNQQQSIAPFAVSAKADYLSGRAAYDPAIVAYKAISRTSSTAVIAATLQQSIAATTALAQAAQSEINFLSEVNDLATANGQKLPAAFATMQTNARSYLSTVNSDLNQLLAEKKTISSDMQTVTTDQQNVQLDQVGNTTGTNPISLQISANNIAKQKEDLATEASKLSDYTIVAPFAGTLSAVDSKVGDDAGSAAVATIITMQNIVELSVNEVDAAKLAVGQKATLTFDAIDGLSLTGTVAEVDTSGAVTQGVVSYGVKITLDSQDARVKSGMTVNADIQTAVHPNVLSVPSSAVKTVNGASYVLVFNPPLADTGGTAGVLSTIAPTQVPVTTGISDDTTVEVDSGLTAGQQIVTRTITGAAATAATTARTTTGATTGAARAGGGNAGFGGAAVRL
jgi:multidrug efflux pump subunit AcrA (membrane-fusion protein)